MTAWSTAPVGSTFTEHYLESLTTEGTMQEQIEKQAAIIAGW